MEIGPIESHGKVRVPFSWQTIRAWARATFTPLSAWEARTLRRMSVAYHGELHAAEDLARPAPWSAMPTQVDHKANERQLRAVLG
jgi:hypothetical protein